MHLRYAFVAALLLVVSGWAQSADRVEIFGGYSFAKNDFTGGTLYNSQTSLNRGWNASANFRLTQLSQFVVDLRRILSSAIERFVHSWRQFVQCFRSHPNVRPAAVFSFQAHPLCSRSFRSCFCTSD